MKPDDRIRLRHIVDALNSNNPFHRRPPRGDLDEDEMLAFAPGPCSPDCWGGSLWAVSASFATDPCANPHAACTYNRHRSKKRNVFRIGSRFYVLLKPMNRKNRT
jgi:hypothetical protein